MVETRHLLRGNVNDFAQKFQRILVVDDDPAILRMLCDKLERQGYEVLTAANGKEAMAVISRRGLPHLAIVDLNMPEMNGFEFCRQVQSYSDLPVIMLTAVDEEETVIRGIEQYAEDYVTKPFSPRELAARVQRVLRRMGDYAYTLAPVMQVDDRLAVDFARQQAWVDGAAVSLTPTETKLLYILMRNAGRTVTTGFLLRRLWPLEDAPEDVLRVYIHQLRKKIRPSESESQYICTERGVGYRFEPRS
jgi:DNA-binding response OmpR family regulator